MATLIEIIIIIIASPEKRVLNNLHCSQVDIGRSAKIIALLRGMMLGSVAGEGTICPLPPPPGSRNQLGATRRFAPRQMPSEESRVCRVSGGFGQFIFRLGRSFHSPLLCMC